MASEQVDQPGTAGGSPELADLGGELAVSRLSGLGDELLPSLDEVIGGEGVELVGCSLEVHGRRLVDQAHGAGAKLIVVLSINRVPPTRAATTKVAGPT